MLKESRESAIRGNVVDLAIALVIGAAFGAIVNSLVKDIIMPFAGLVALAMFVVVRLIDGTRKAEQVAETKDCPFFLSAIPIPATRCPQRTSALEEA